MRRAARALTIVTVMIASGPSPARAANEAHVRTPVLWPSQCAVIVDRSVEPIVRFDYAIPVEDTELTPDELPDSRTHQFAALCRERPLTELLPSWITRDDVERSAAAKLIPTDELSASAILDESLAWSDCFVRITADDDRRPITFAQAAIGVEWDTSEVASGVWSIAGYTFEPPLNLWRDRPGFVKIVDDRSDPAQDLPAIALLGSEQAVEPGGRIALEACVDVLEPASVVLEWAEFAPQLEWRSLSTVAVEADGPLQLELTAPSAAAERELLVRARLVDALGRERISHLPARIAVLPCPAAGCVDPIPEPPAEPDPPPTDGCACVTVTHPGHLLGMLLGLLGLPGLARRRRSVRSPTQNHVF